MTPQEELAEQMKNKLSEITNLCFPGISGKIKEILEHPDKYDAKEVGKAASELNNAKEIILVTHRKLVNLKESQKN